MFVAIAATMVSGRAVAQNYNLPTAGSINTEVQFNPFSDNDQFKIEGLKVRYFITDKDAIRLTLGLEMDNKNDMKFGEAPDEDDEVKTAFYNYQTSNEENKTKTGKFSIDLGYERHLVKNGRMDLYVGAGLGFETSWNTTNVIDAFQDMKDPKDGETLDPKKVSSWNFYTKETETKGNNAYSAFRAGIFTGLDFYLYKGLYIGTELGLKFSNKSYKDYEQTVTDNNPKTAQEDRVDEVTRKNDSSASSLKFSVEPRLRLGWSF